MKLKLSPFSKPLKGSFTVPGSKSITNRVLPLAALSGKKIQIFGALKSEDTDAMIEALKKLGVSIEEKYSGGANYDYIEIHGEKGRFAQTGDITLDCKNSGTTLRFLTALCILRKGNTLLGGNDRMQERPIRDLGDALQNLGIEVEYLEKQGFPPIGIQGNLNISSKTVPISGNISSQFVSALLLLATHLPDINIDVRGNLVSQPYVEMTFQILKNFVASEYTVEADATSATYPMALAAITGGKVVMKNIPHNSLQGDAQFAEIVLKKMGCDVSWESGAESGERPPLHPPNNHLVLSSWSKEGGQRGISVIGPKKLQPLGEINLELMPDAAMTAVVLSACAEGRSRITGLSTLKYKECDRIHALTKNLKKMGANIESGNDAIEIHGDPSLLHGAEIETYDDHRVAMCFSVLGAVVSDVVIQNPECVRKTYPTYWEEYEEWQDPSTPLRVDIPRKIQKNIVLIGMRGSGKTTLGKAFAEKYGHDFVDTDQEIEKISGKTISKIVEQGGWDAFRELEKEICKSLANVQNTVIATGGGVVLNSKNMEYLKKNGEVIFLNVPIQELIQRLQNTSKKRPVLKSEKPLFQEVEEIWNERKDLFQKYADAELSEQENIEQSVELLQRLTTL